MGIIGLILTLSLLSHFTMGSLLGKNVILAINCGSRVPYSNKEFEYSFDKYFKNGSRIKLDSEYRKIWPVLDDIQIYNTGRYGNDEDFTYTLPLLETNRNGKYVLILKFSEIIYKNPMERVFDIGLGNKTIITNLDIAEEVGYFFPLNIYIKLRIKDNNLIYKGNLIDSAITSNRSLVVNFIKGKVGNPMVNGIILVKGKIASTDYDDYNVKYYERNKIIQKLRGNEKQERSPKTLFENIIVKEIKRVITDMKDAFKGLGGVVVVYIFVFFIIFNIVNVLITF